MPSSNRSRRQPQNSVIRLLQKGLAIIALIDLGLVIFDLSYIPLRDTYLSTTPALTRQYDQLKGIVDHRETKAYLDQVVLLEAQLQQSGPAGDTITALLQDLRSRSEAMVDENPFEKVNKTGTLEKIKNRMRRHLPNPQNSSKEAFRTFWSTQHLTATNWQAELDWFKRKIVPPMATNYFRPYAENNALVDHFWRIDLIFIAIFGLDFLVRTAHLSRRYAELSWFDAMLWRWYDIFLLLPFLRILRVIPVALRLHQAQLINLDRAQVQSNRFLAETIVGEVTELVMVRTIGVAQSSIRQGAIRNWLLAPTPKTVEINDVNEVEELINKVLRITVQRVLPTLQPDIEAMVRHSMVSALDTVPLHRELQQLPGIGNIQATIAHQAVEQFTQIAMTTVDQVLDDEKGREIFNQLSQNFTLALRQELSDQKTLKQIELLLNDFLEETKLTLIQQLETEAPEQTIDDMQQLRQETQMAQQLTPAEVIR